MGAKPELDWIATGLTYLGEQEIKGPKHNPKIIHMLDTLNAWWRNDEEAWCGVFVAYCLKQSGVKYPKHWYRALDYLNYGAKLHKPAYGCVAVKSRKGGGHVCFVVGKTNSGKLVCLGGNQGDKVCYALYNESDFEEFRWYGKTSTPSAHRFTLPIFTNITATKVTEA